MNSQLFVLGMFASLLVWCAIYAYGCRQKCLEMKEVWHTFAMCALFAVIMITAGTSFVTSGFKDRSALGTALLFGLLPTILYWRQGRDKLAQFKMSTMLRE